MRTTIDIQDSLIQEILKTTGAKSKKNAVETALREYIRTIHRKKLASLIGNYHDFALDIADLKEMRDEQ